MTSNWTREFRSAHFELFSLTLPLFYLCVQFGRTGRNGQRLLEIRENKKQPLLSKPWGFGLLWLLQVCSPNEVVILAGHVSAEGRACLGKQRSVQTPGAWQGRSWRLAAHVYRSFADCRRTHTALQNIINREVDPMLPSCLTIGKMEYGTAACQAEYQR